MGAHPQQRPLDLEALRGGFQERETVIGLAGRDIVGEDRAEHSEMTFGAGICER